MERLTSSKKVSEMSTYELANLRARLKEYEDLEEQGKLLKLPCALGDWVYQIKDGWVNPCKVAKIEVDGNTESDVYFKSNSDPEKWPFCTLDDFGKTVFLTESDAEQTLKEMGRKNENYAKK